MASAARARLASAAAHLVFADTALFDVDTDCEQFAVDAGAPRAGFS